ncbi:uncharacterized protein LOC129971345 [Argiope bruennichi]|uniref:uncharacterized protein LOC129971345 n=1 Tax=Argiope bruennichi TaxID=94029 RepID=UPI00249514DB|nr:uncharacterized protein LOC129971345 [Argiope bruennichi]
MNVILFPMHFIFEKEKLSINILRNSAVTTEEKLCIALRFFASGSHQQIIGDFDQTSQSSCCRAINEVSRCIAEMRPRFIYLPNNESERLEIKNLQRYGRNKEQPFPSEKKRKERKKSNKQKNLFHLSGDDYTGLLFVFLKLSCMTHFHDCTLFSYGK